jgi:polyisoprenoid-binding protein YceI
MKIMLKSTIRVIVIGLIVTLNTYSQQPLKLFANGSIMTIKGTSSLHDWEEKVEKFNVQLVLKFSNMEIAGVDKVLFTCQSASITSENSLMTNKTHDALLVEKNPEIVFSMLSVEKLNSVNGRFSGILIGDLKLAGVIKRVSIAFTGINENNKLTITGSKDIRMNDYSIKPPTAMLGTLKTGEIVTISFMLQFQVN